MDPILKKWLTLGWLEGYRRGKEIWLFLLITDQCVHLVSLLQARKQ
jgi:hypothetical protein